MSDEAAYGRAEVRFARREERGSPADFGEGRRVCAEHVPAFFPRFGRPYADEGIKHKDETSHLAGVNGDPRNGS